MAVLGIRISIASVRPCPLDRGSSAWQRIPSKVSESCERTCGCWFGGKTSMMRLIVCAAELVCSVANVRWPVSATRSAHSIVSRSRISPISTMSGSCRSTERSAAGKERVSVPISRWLTRQRLWECRYSIGSSIVTMCDCRSRLILSIIAASVVLLPEPVGPVTSTRPRGRSASWETVSGRPSSWNDLISQGIVRKAAPTAPRWLKTLARKRASPLMPNEKSSSRFSSKRCFCWSVITE